MTRTYLLWITLLLCASLWTVALFRYVFPAKCYLLKSRSLREVNGRSHLSQLSAFTSSTRTTNANKQTFSTRTDDRGTKNPESVKSGKTPKRSQNYAHDDDLLARYAGSFGRDWCRIRRARLDWEEYLSPCAEHTRWETKDVEWGLKIRTNATNSVIFHWDIRPAGEFSRFFIQSRTSPNKTKRIGGDAWRIHINGVASVSPTVFDHKNGTYEVMFLMIDPGVYELHIVLDYSLCDGLKDPPVDWYKKGNIQGKNQPDGTLGEESPYLMERFGNGKPILINILKPSYSKNFQYALDRIRSNYLERSKKREQPLCHPEYHSLMGNWYGRWVNDSWIPFVKDIDIKQEPHDRKGILWFYGDSVSKMFKEALSTGKFNEVCSRIFKRCQITYSWIYNMDDYMKENGEEPIPDGVDYDHEKVMREIKKVLHDGSMDKDSVVLLNLGIHFVAAVNFSNYQRLIDELIKTIKIEKRRGCFKGKIIWRTTTAIFRERYPNPHKDVRRFLTFPRILLYNAYATSAMCRAGVEVIDVYPLTDAFPTGTFSQTDPVHYDRRAFESVEALMYRKFKLY